MFEPTHVMVNGCEYVLGRLNLFDALDISRKIAPLAPALINEVIGKLASEFSDASKSAEDKAMNLALLLTASKPALDILARMPREDFEGVVKTALSVVEKKTAAGYARVISGGQLMFDDLDQVTALALTIHVIARELNPIFASLNA